MDKKDCGSEKNVIGQQNGYANVSANKTLIFNEDVLRWNE